MLLPAEDARLFHQLYPALLGFIAGRLGGIQGVHDLASFQACSLEAKPQIRDQVYENLPLLDVYVNERILTAGARPSWSLSQPGARPCVEHSSLCGI